MILASGARGPGFNPRCLQGLLDLKGPKIFFKTPWQWWDSNPRPFRLVPKTSALDHSATLPDFTYSCLFSSVVEHQSRKLGVVGSNPTGGRYFLGTPQKNLPKSTQLAGFEPTRAEPIGFQVQRLNHSATTAIWNLSQKISWRCGGLNPGPFTCKANALPLSYIPSHAIHTKISIGISQY